MSKDTIITQPISRRTFAKIMGAAGAATGLGAAGAKMFVDASQAEAAVTVSNAIGCCKICGSECQYIAKQSGSHWELFGNPNSPTDNIWGDGKGRMCVKGYSGPEKALNPDRLFYPMVRTNPNKGPNEDPKFMKVTWAEAYRLAAKKLNETVAQYGGKGVAVLSRGNDWSNRFQPALGTPNKMGHQSTCFTTHTWAWPALVPQVAKGGRSWTHDYGNSTYLLSFGHDQVGRAQNPTVQGVIKALENGAKMTVFDPRLSITAAKALAYPGGRYYAVKPGNDLPVIWAMIKWIVANGKQNAAFISGYVNATDWADFQTFVNSNGFAATELAPGASVAEVADWAAAKSGVPAADILAIAEEFTNNGDYTDWRPICMTHKRDGAGGPNYDNSWRTAYAQLVLDILVGAVDREGGNIIDRTFTFKSFDTICIPPVGGYPPIEKNDAGVTYNRVDYRNKWTGASGGQGSFETLASAIVDDDPYPIRYLFISYYNLPFNSTDTARTVAAMNKCFVVQHGALADESAWMADVLMPDLATYENTYISESGKVQGMSKYAFIKISEPMFPRLGDTASQATTYAKVAEQADNGGGGTFPTWAQANQAYYDAQSAAWKAQNATYMTNRNSLRQFCTLQGTPGGTEWTGGAVQDARLADLAAGAPANGWTTTITSRSTFRSQRGWAGDKSGIFPKPSEAPAFVNYSRLSANSIRLDITARGAGEYARVADPANPKGAAIVLTERFPGWAPPFKSGAYGAGKFMMLVNREPMSIHTESKAEDMMVELSGPQRIEIHPNAATALGIVDGDRIRMTSDATGAVGYAAVRLTNNIREDCVLVAHGWGHWQLSSRNNEVDSRIGAARPFGFNASAGVGADDNAFVMPLPLQVQANRRDPSCSAVMTDVLLTVAKA